MSVVRDATHPAQLLLYAVCWDCAGIDDPNNVRVQFRSTLAHHRLRGVLLKPLASSHTMLFVAHLQGAFLWFQGFKVPEEA